MTSQELAELLIQQATPEPHYIQLSDETLQQTGISALIKQNLLRQDGTLMLVVDPNSIPTNPPASGFSLSAQTPSLSSDTFLNLAARDVPSINFICDGTNVEFTLTINLKLSNNRPVGWVLSDSYPELRGLPFDEVELPSPQMIFATQAGGTPPQGLNFQSTFKLNNLFEQITELLSGGNAQLSDGRSFTELQQSGGDTYTIKGALTQSAKGVNFALEANLNVPSFQIGTIFEMNELVAGISQQTLTTSDGEKSTLLMLYLGAYVTLKNSSGTEVKLALKAILPVNAQASLMTLAIYPTDPFQTSLANLTQLVAGNSWSDFFSGQASSIGSLLSTFGFKSFVTTYSLSTFSVNSFSLNVGTLQPWPLFSPLQSMTLDIDWMILFIPGGNIQTLTISAVFNFTDDLSFDVEVVLPDLVITGVEHGPPTTLTLSQIANTVFGGNIGIPEELLTFSFSDLNIGINYPNQNYSFGATASLSFNLFGTQILSLDDMVLQVAVNTKGKTTYTATLNGYISLGPITFVTNATLSNQQDTVFELQLVNETLGSMLNHLVHLVDPTYDISFDAPWDKLLAINLDDFLLKVNVTQKSVALSYSPSGSVIDLGFMTITSISLNYKKSETLASSVQIELSGRFLGQSFGQDGQAPLSWDAMNQQPPAVPGAGTSKFDLQYAGLGQHITFTNLDKLTTVEKVMTAMINSVIPTSGNALPAFGQNGLAFDKNSNWLIGAQFTVMGTLSLSIIFNDPNLYGLLISLAGPQAKSFAGLSFEILYRKVTETIGVYHIELKLPDAMRNLQFGSVSLTLPVIVLDIYTNGNFRVDFGFPQGLDFSRSFCLQILPFIGYGGFYFALLNGQTSTRVPQITNGNFNPVIEFGIALSIGVGKTINAGVLSGGISVTVVGILEGVIGWFNPNDASVEKAEYYWLQGTIAIVGKLYATIDFKIIKADLNVTAYASVTLLIEAHQPIYINLVAGVSVKVSLKIIFFTIHLSFSAQIKASFTIGSASPTPWRLASKSSSASTELRQLRGQDTLHHPQSRFAGLSAALRAERMMAALFTDPPLNWAPVPVFPDGQKQSVDVYPLPSFSKSETVADGVNAILLLCLENSIAPDAVTHREHRQLYGEAPQLAEFNLLLQGILYWAIYARRTSLGKDTSTVTADDLAFLKQKLADTEVTEQAFNYSNLTAFIAQNFIFTMQQPPQNGDSAVGVTIFPIFPTVSAEDVSRQSAFADDDYQKKIDVYFNLLQVQYKQGTASDNNESGQQSAQAAAAASDDTSVSIATVVFEQYFGMLARSAVNAAGDMLAQFQLTTTTASSIQDIINSVGDSSVTPQQVVAPNVSVPAILNTGAGLALSNILYQVMSGDSFASIAASFSAQGALSSEGQPLQAGDIAAANFGSTGIFTLNTQVVFSTDDINNPNRITYATQTGDTLNVIASRLLVRSGPASLFQQFLNLNQYMLAVINANQEVTPNPDGTLKPGTELNIPDLANPGQTDIYTTVAGDTFNLVAAYFLAIPQQVVAYAGLVTEILEINTLQITDPTQQQPPGTTLNIPPVTRNLQAADTINSLAVTLITTPAIIQAWLVAVTGSLLAPQSVLSMPALQYKIAAADTLNSIAQKFNLSLTQLAEDLMEPLKPQDPATVPKVFAAEASVIVNDVESISVQTLMASLLNQGEWNNIAGMVSRFLLNGLRLPDPANTYFAGLTVEQLENPTSVDFTKIATQPMYALTGQQFAIGTNPPPPDITIQNSDPVSWLISASGGEFTKMQIDLSAYKQLIEELAGTPLDPQIQSLTRLELFQMTPSRFTLQKQLHWQAAVLPSSPCFKQTAQATGGPSLWLFPDSLTTQLTSGAESDLKYQLVIGTHQDATVPMSISDVRCYNWATMVNLTISLPQVDGSTPTSIANSYVVLGADENGRDLLQDLYVYLTKTNTGDKATLYLLYSPNPSSTNSYGLISDNLNPTQTYLLKTNLSTLSQSGPQAAPEALGQPGTDDELYDATLSDPASFIKLLWECSIVHSGGYYLNYVNADGNKGLPGELFAQGQTATLSLLIMLESQGQSALPPIYSFNNCVVVDDNVDASQSNIFVQPVVYVVPQGDSLASVVNDYDANSGSSLTVEQFATFNENQTPLLLVGATLEIPGQTQGYTIAVSDTLSGIAAKFSTNVQTLVATGSNAQAPILTRGLTAYLSDSGGPSPLKEAVPAGDSLTDAANFYNNSFGGSLTATDVAMLNADIPLLLLMGAELQITGKPNYEIQYGDTLSSIAKEFETDVRTLVAMGKNGFAAILAPGAQAQFNQGVLQPAATVPQGNVGFELTRTNPDPYNSPWAELKPQQIVASLFHLLRYSIAAAAPGEESPGFVASGLGLPTGPSNSSQSGTSGVAPGEQLDGVELEWCYQQTIAVAPFAISSQGSMSPALPPAGNSPFAGVAPKNSVTLDFSLQDIYGNEQELQSPYGSLTIPVGYYTEITALNRWPGMACSYEVLPGNPPQIKLQLNMQIDKYLPSASVSVESAQSAASGDLASYAQIYYQTQQQDLNFALETSLNSDSIDSAPPVYPINPKTPFTSFVNAAYIFLNALQSLKQFVYTCSGEETVGDFFTKFGVQPAQLFEANANRAYSALFGQAQLSVPTMYPTIQDDSLSSVSVLFDLTPLALATNNAYVPLNPGIALAAPNRPYKVHDGYNLQQIAVEWRTTITGIAEANRDIKNILKPDNLFTVEGVSYAVGQQDTFDSMVQKFENDPNKPLKLTVAELATAVAETVPAIFIDGVTLRITEIVTQQADAARRAPYKVHDNYSLKQVAQELNLSVIGIALASHNLLNILQPGVELSANNVSLPVGPDDTFDSMAQALEDLSKLPVTVADLAVVNQAVQGIFRDGAVLQVTQKGDSFNGLANDYAADGFTVEALVNPTNEALPNIFAPGTPLFITANPVAPHKNDTLSSYASNNHVTTDQLAEHNAGAAFAASAELDIPSLVFINSTTEYPVYVADGTETVEKIAQMFPPLYALSLVTLNQNAPGLLASGFTVTIEYDQKTFSVETTSADTFNTLLAKFAAQDVPITLVDLALDVATLPDLVAKGGVWLCARHYSSYVALGSDTLGGIAGKYPNLTPALLAILNQDIQGLFAPEQTIKDPQSQKSITTATTDSFNSLLGKFEVEGVTLSLVELVSYMAAQQNLLQPKGVWIAPPMVAANSFAVGTENTLAGLATKYNLDLDSLAQANAGVRGFLASKVNLSYEGKSFETNENETFNSLVTRIGQAGFTATVSDLAAAFASVNGLLNPLSLVVPLPAPTQTSIALTTPKFSDAIFALTVDVLMRRDTDCVDPDFVNVESVYEARTPIAPESTPYGGGGNQSALSLVEFATNFESAFPGLHVASGLAASADDQDTERKLWAVNFGSQFGPQMNYKFESGDKMQFFAVPPLSTSLMSDTAQVIPYVSGVGLTGPPQTMNFQSIDLDVWANTFLQAVDLFLLPSYAVPAYALQTTPSPGKKLTPYENVVAQKGVLAQAISEQVEYILQTGTVDPDAVKDAREALRQALLVQLSNAYSINSIVQVPVHVQSNYDPNHASLAPRLSGQPANSLKVAGATNTEPINITSPQHNLATGDVVIVSGVLGNVAANGDWTITVIDANTFSLNGSNGTESGPYVPNTGTITVETARVNDFSLSTAKVPLVNGTDRATFLFTVKSPADNKQANLTLQYVINQLEVPTTEAATIDDYQASNWLTFILPLADQNSAIGQVAIPIPLRSYPSPVTLVGQAGEQSYPEPTTPEELYNWDYSFTYQHQDADQDTTSLKVQFNSGSGLEAAFGEPGLFDALAQFIAVYPQLKDDLALLPMVVPGAANNTALVAIQTFSQLVEQVAGVWGMTPAALRRLAKGMAAQPYAYTLQRQKSESNPSQLSRLIIIADENNASELWPDVEVYLDGEFQPLIMEVPTPGRHRAVYDYPPGVLAENSLKYQMKFQYLNVTNIQDGWAGVSITRNADLVQTAQTNTAFIYQTPWTYFSSVMIPFIYGGADIDIKIPPTVTLAQALGQFFQTLLSCNPNLPAGTTRNIRVACNYGYQLAAPTVAGLSERRPLPGLRADGNSNPLVSFMPVILIPSYPFDLSKSYDWQDPNSFVSLLAKAIIEWQGNNQPSTTNGAFFFDISLFSTLDPSNLQPLLQAPYVRYVLDEGEKP